MLNVNIDLKLSNSFSIVNLRSYQSPSYDLHQVLIIPSSNQSLELFDLNTIKININDFIVVVEVHVFRWRYISSVCYF